MKQIIHSCAIAFGLVLLIVISPVTSPARAADQILLRDFVINELGSPTKLSASVRVQYEMSDYLRQALLNGLTLRHTFAFDLRYYRWWWDSAQPFARVESELQYHALSQHYHLVRLDTQESWNFPSLISALEHMGFLQNYRLPDLPANALNNNASILMVATLAPKTPAISLRLRSMFSNQYAIRSQGVMWPLP